MDIKVCTKCGIEKDFSEFGKQKDGRFGLKSRCKECLIQDHKIYNESNKDIINEKHRVYRKTNKDKCSAYGKMYREKDTEKWKEWHAEYRENNKDIIAFRNRRLNQSEEGKKKARIRVVKRRTIKKNLPSTLTTREWESVKSIFENKCAYCGKEKPLEQEHFIALTLGGEHAISNIIPACKSCNSSKRDRDFFEWYPKYKHYSKQREKFLLNHLNYRNGVQQIAIGLF